MPDFALTVKNQYRATLRTEEGNLLECTPDTFSGGGGGGGAAGNGAATSYVYRPGGVTGNGVFATATALKAALALLDPSADKTIVVDTSIAAAHLTAADSPWPLDNTTFESNTADILNIDAGCVINANNLRVRGMALVVAAGSVATVWAPPGVGGILDLQTANIVNNSAVPWIAVTPGAVFDLIARVGSAVQSGSGPHVVIANGASAEAFVIDGSALQPNVFVHGTAPGGMLALVFDGASQPLVSTTQDNANLTVTVTNAAPQSTFVFRPGGVAGGNVFTTAATLQNAIKLTPGRREVLCDGTFAALHFSGAGWDLDNTTLRVQNNGANFVLNLDIGFTMTSFDLRICDGLTVQSNATVTPWVPAGFFQLHIEEGASLYSTTAAPFLSVTAASSASQVFLSRQSGLGDAVHNAITVAAGQSLTVLVAGPQQAGGGIVAHAFGGLGTVNVFGDGSQLISGTQDVSNFNSTNGLANFVQATANTGTGTANVTAVTGNIQKKKTGLMAVSALVSGVLSGAGTVTVTLLRDATPIGTAVPYVALATATGFVIPINFIDTAPDFAVHTYTVKAAASAGTIATAAGGAQIEVLEL